MKRIAIIAALVLAGCDAPQPQQGPEMAVLMQSCQAGNTQSCTTIAQLRQQEANRRSQIYAAYAQSQRTYVAPQFPQMSQSRRTVCQPGYGGQVTCTSN